ncbi:trigger factor [Rurimicrobium arvi]|uniref:Trigger factor n=1 Tax=Rurimicrobium arvi TaxID=2049916 RepID=A0ABP8MPI9_9BACT
MAVVTRENVGNLQDKITVKLSKEDFLPSFEKSLKSYAKNATVPGFRKGMVPSGMIKKMYGQSIFNEEVIRTASRELENYLQAEKIAIFAKPMVASDASPLALDMAAPADVDFAFEVGLKPDFAIPAIDSKTSLTFYKIEVSDTMVEDEVKRIARRFGKAEDKDAIEQNDDIAYATIVPADASGNPIEGAEKIEDTSVLERYPEKLRDMLKGKKAGDSFSFRPTDVCSKEELAAFLKNIIKNESAAEQTFVFNLTKAGYIIPAEVNETLYAQVFPNAEVKDEATFRDMIRKELDREFTRISEDRLNSEMYEVLVHKTPFDIPVPFLKRWLKEGQDQPKTEQQVEAEFPSFEHQLRWTLISDKLITDNKIEVSMEEVNQDIKGRVLSYFGMENDDDAPWMDGYMQKITKDEKALNETYQRLMFDRLFGYLRTAFSINEQKVSEEEFFKLKDPHAMHHHHAH